MGWKGTLRSINAEMNRQSRAADKRHREHLKQAERDEASATVQNQADYLEEIVSLHNECRTDMDWDDIANEPEPQSPGNNKPLTMFAQNKLENFTPNLIDKIPKVKAWRKKMLEKKLEKEKQQDEINHTQNIAIYEREKLEWDKTQRLSSTIKTDKDTLLEVFQEYLNVKDLPIGEDVKLTISDEMEVDVYLKVSPIEEIIPDEEYSLRQSGMLSTKRMAKGKALDLYQDHVCSALLRIAREVLGVIPMNVVRANAVMNAVNTKTGHLEDQIILSAIIPKATLETLNLNNVDPSNSFENFIHNMKFQKTKGFNTVEKANFPEN